VASVVGLYYLTRAVTQNHIAALIAAALLSLDPGHRFISQLATYDIISFTFLVYGLLFTYYACEHGRYRWDLTLLAATLLCAAALSKYTTFIILPIIGVIALVRAPKQAIFAGFVIAVFVSHYAITNLAQLKVLFEVQILGTHEQNALHFDVLIRTIRQQVWIFILASISITYLNLWHREKMKTVTILFCLSLPLFLYHFLGQNIISLQKHLVFMTLFLIPIVALAVSQYLSTGSSTLVGKLLLVAALPSLFLLSQYHLKTMQNSYPNVSAIVSATNEMPDQKSVLSEDPYLFRYQLLGRTPQYKLNETTWLDNDNDGIREAKDVKHAVWDKKYDYVYLNDQQHPGLNESLRKMMKLQGYSLVVSEEYILQTMSGRNRHGTMTLHANRKPAEIAGSSDVNQ